LLFISHWWSPFGGLVYCLVAPSVYPVPTSVVAPVP